MCLGQVCTCVALIWKPHHSVRSNVLILLVQCIHFMPFALKYFFSFLSHSCSFWITVAFAQLFMSAITVTVLAKVTVSCNSSTSLFFLAILPYMPLLFLSKMIGNGLWLGLSIWAIPQSKNTLIFLMKQCLTKNGMNKAYHNVDVMHYSLLSLRLLFLSFYKISHGFNSTTCISFKIVE